MSKCNNCGKEFKDYYFTCNEGKKCPICPCLSSICKECRKNLGI